MDSYVREKEDQVKKINCKDNTEMEFYLKS